MQPHPAHPWTKAPALRLLAPFMIGILAQWYAPIPFTTLVIAGLVLLPAVLLYTVLPLPKRFRLAPLQGTLLSLLLGVVAPRPYTIATPGTVTAGWATTWPEARRWC